MPEPHILGHHDGVLKTLRNLVERNRLTVFQLIAEDRRQQLRLERRVVDRPRLPERDDRLDAAGREVDADRLLRILTARMTERPRVDVDLLLARRVVAGLTQGAVLPVTEPVELLQ